MRAHDEIDLARTFWLSIQGGEATGPFTLEQLAHMFRAGAIYATAQVCEVGYEQWHPVTRLRSEYPLLFGGLQARPAVAPADPSAASYNTGAYRVLGVLFGIFGVHNFYAGEIGSALWKLLFLLGSFLGSAVSPIIANLFLLLNATWSLIEVILGHQILLANRPATLREKVWTGVVVLVLIYIIFMAAFIRASGR